MATTLLPHLFDRPRTPERGRRPPPPRPRIYRPSDPVRTPYRTSSPASCLPILPGTWHRRRRRQPCQYSALPRSRIADRSLHSPPPKSQHRPEERRTGPSPREARAPSPSLPPPRRFPSPPSWRSIPIFATTTAPLRPSYFRQSAAGSGGGCTRRGTARRAPSCLFSFPAVLHRHLSPTPPKRPRTDGGDGPTPSPTRPSSSSTAGAPPRRPRRTSAPPTASRRAGTTTTATFRSKTTRTASV
mmetsp:Transcript_1951/g.5166  ORF Transcript_1951/g.5166 Transcript_1951/m.5166 type:complete len:243 (-) Transcript_1951:934-1662(-)